MSQLGKTKPYQIAMGCNMCNKTNNLQK